MARNDRVVKHKSLSVLYLDGSNVVQFGFNTDNPELVSGIELLLQNIIIALFTTEASNAFNTTFGGSLYSIIGKGYEVGHEELVKAEFSLAFSTVETQIKNLQEGVSNIPPNERLRKIDLQSLVYDKSAYAWIIDTKITSAGGESATFTINN